METTTASAAISGLENGDNGGDEELEDEEEDVGVVVGVVFVGGDLQHDKCVSEDSSDGGRAFVNIV